MPYFWMGIKAYDMISGRQLVKSSYYVSKSKALEEFPMLKGDRLCGAIVYYDGTQLSVSIIDRQTVSIIDRQTDRQTDRHSRIRAVSIIQWNLRVMDTLGPGVLSFIERLKMY